MPAENHSILRTVTAPGPRWRVWLLQLVLFAAVYGGVVLYRSQDVATGVAPDFSALTLDGQHVSIRGLQGRPVLLHFWASWCSICRFEQSSIDAIAREHTVVTVASYSGGHQEIADYVKAQAIHAPVVVDEQGELARRYGVRGFPTTLIIDSAGIIRDVQIGYTSEWGLRLRLWYYAKQTKPEANTHDG